MFNRFERLMAFRYLRARRREGFISVIAVFSLLGIALGVATLIVVMSVMNGFRDELLSRVLGLNGHANIRDVAGQMANYDDLIGLVGPVEGVVRAFPVIEGQGLITQRGNATGVVVRGMRPEDLMNKPVVGEALSRGDYAGLADGGIAIGSRLAQRFGLDVGSTLSLISPKGNPTPFGTMPRAQGFEVVAIFDVGMFEYDSGFAFISLDAAQTFLRLGDTVSAVELFVENPDRVNATLQDVYEQVGPGVRLVPWQQINGSFFNALQVERNVMFLILTLIIIVAAFNIISGLIMLVKDKGRDIAILRTMGASRGAVMRIFLLTGSSLGIIGTIVGLILAMLITENLAAIQVWLESVSGSTVWDPTIRFLTRIPSKTDWGEVVAVVAMSLVLSFLATLYPSWRAARLDPVEALRYE
ncbi:MAG: lipoprotein-releasing ABC transporter permease subunit [Alphaproteobacteria bacterium]|nr:lipoprotein-releasing ABC transporter permease subunit [Alphaproteobacteria bacterium SS10]